MPFVPTHTVEAAMSAGVRAEAAAFAGMAVVLVVLLLYSRGIKALKRVQAPHLSAYPTQLVLRSISSMTSQLNIVDNLDAQVLDIWDSLEDDGVISWDFETYEGLLEDETAPYLINVPLDLQSPAYHLVEFDDHWVCTEIHGPEGVPANQDNVQHACASKLESTPAGLQSRMPAPPKRARRTETDALSTIVDTKRG